MTGAAPDLPDVFRPYFAGLDEQAAAAGDRVFRRCFGCGPAHPRGLHVRCFVTPEGVASPIIIEPDYEGPPGAAHGGIVAAYLDEVLSGTVARAIGRSAVTGELTVRYVKPVPTATPLLGRGWLVADHGRYVDVAGQLQRLAGDETLATARARFFPLTR